MRPSVGRMVHYVNLGDRDGKYPAQTQAAVITAIYREVCVEGEGFQLERVNDGVGDESDGRISDLVDLKVFYKTGLFDCEKVPLRKVSDQRGCWDWPPKL